MTRARHTVNDDDPMPMIGTAELIHPMRHGIPRLDELDALLASDDYARHVAFNRDFLAANDAAMERYGRLWAKDTFHLWSRRWEYPFVASRVLRHAGASPPDQPYRVLDAGSGVTYFPYFIAAEVPRAEFVCFDSNLAYHGMFAEINRANPRARVRFEQGMLQDMPFDDGAFDAVCCISVLEHTSNYSEILAEFRRVLRPGGLLALTFDLSLDGRFELARPAAADLLREVDRLFAVEDATGDELLAELDRMDRERDRIVSTDHFRRTQPDLLPWKHPLAKAMHDLVKGNGWTAGFRSKSVFCLSAVAK